MTARLCGLRASYIVRRLEGETLDWRHRLVIWLAERWVDLLGLPACWRTRRLFRQMRRDHERIQSALEEVDALLKSSSRGEGGTP